MLLWVYTILHRGINMKTETKKLVITIINIAIFVGNAIISFISGGGDVATVASLSTGILTGVTLV